MPPERLQMHTEDARKRSDTLITSLKNAGDDIEKTRTIAHELTGMLGNFGFKLARTEAENFKEAVSAGTAAPERIGTLEHLLETSWRLLEEEIKEP